MDVVFINKLVYQKEVGKGEASPMAVIQEEEQI